MVSHRFSLRSAHLVMWSSPLLLLVLVFTLTNSTGSPTKPEANQRPVASSVPALHPPVTGTTTATSTTTSPPATTTSEASVTPYGNATSSTVRSVALAPSVNVSSGALEGSLSPAFPVAAVPLQGPGSWTLATSAAANSLLVCSNQDEVVTARVTIVSNLSCQLEITSSRPGVSQTWQLTPTR